MKNLITIALLSIALAGSAFAQTAAQKRQYAKDTCNTAVTFAGKMKPVMEEMVAKIPNLPTDQQAEADRAVTVFIHDVSRTVDDSCVANPIPLVIAQDMARMGEDMHTAFVATGI